MVEVTFCAPKVPKTGSILLLIWIILWTLVAGWGWGGTGVDGWVVVVLCG